MGWRGESVRHQCQLSQALSHILILCLFILDKEDIQPIDSHKMRLENQEAPMGGGHIRGQLALFFGLCQPNNGLTLSPLSPAL